MDTSVVYIIITVVLAGIFAYRLLYKPPATDIQLKQAEERAQALVYEADSLKVRVGMLEGLLHSKDKDLTAVQENMLALQSQLNDEINRNAKVVSQSKSSQVRLGGIVETLAPFMMEGYDHKRMRFLGNPIDLIAFEEHGIYFIEIKSGDSKMSKGQKHIKKLIEAGKVYFKDFRIKGAK
jgi:predicted Holliday junction resolvase-like endonuclease